MGRVKQKLTEEMEQAAGLGISILDADMDEDLKRRMVRCVLRSIDLGLSPEGFENLFHEEVFSDEG